MGGNGQFYQSLITAGYRPKSNLVELERPLSLLHFSHPCQPVKFGTNQRRAASDRVDVLTQLIAEWRPRSTTCPKRIRAQRPSTLVWWQRLGLHRLALSGPAD